MDTHAHDIKSEVKGYVIVFAALAGLTLVTVAVKSLHLRLEAAIAVALIIATVKGSLVVCYFMHLISEKKLIYTILIFTVIFIAGLFILLLSGHHDTQAGTQYLTTIAPPTGAAESHH